MDKLVQVALKIAHNNGIFTYRVPDGQGCKSLFGRRVKVTLKNQEMLGVIIGDEGSTLPCTVKIKDILTIIDDEPVITEEQFDLIKFSAQYYFNPLGPSVHLAVPRNEKKARAKSLVKEFTAKKSHILSPDQTLAVDTILAHQPMAILLEGVTGSGKTHVYINVAEAVLAQNKSALFIVPEISLTPQLVERVESGLAQKAVVIHSNITSAKKRDGISELLNGHARVVIGARSAIFAPLKNLGLVVVDEEHDSSFKQDESPRYNARDLALWRGKNEKALVILGSATPSLETIVNAKLKKLLHLTLKNRYQEKRPLPEVTIIDLKERARDIDHYTKDQAKTEGQKMCIISRPLKLEMEKTLGLGAQVLLFLNQRGYAKFGVCYQCGRTVECPNCSVGLTYYQNRSIVSCHLCQYQKPAATICQNCQQDAIRFLGLGTERLEKEVKTLFPQNVVVRLDRDVVKSERRLLDTLNAMHEQRAQILIGTQMIAKGHDFLHVGLVGVVCADVALSMPDFRSSEKTFQLLTQVAGRAGRGHFIGKAMIQTFNPTHPSITYAKDHNVKDFVEQEVYVRKRFLQPPFSRAAILRAEHENKDFALEAMTKAKKLMANEKDIQILGPTPSPIERINSRFRFQCMAMANTYQTLHQAIKRAKNDKALDELIKKRHVRFIIDVDPQNLM